MNQSVLSGTNNRLLNIKSDENLKLSLKKSSEKICYINSNLPAYSGKHIVRGDFLIFSSNKSFLFRNKIMEVSVNHLLLQIESNNFKLSCIRF